PEIDHDRCLLRAVHDFLIEGAVLDFDDPRRFRHNTLPERTTDYLDITERTKAPESASDVIVRVIPAIHGLILRASGSISSYREKHDCPDQRRVVAPQPAAIRLHRHRRLGDVPGVVRSVADCVRAGSMRPTRGRARLSPLLFRPGRGQGPAPHHDGL